MEGLGSLLLFAVLFYFLMRFGCGSHMTHGHSRSDGADKEAKHIDPVCDTEVETEQGYGKMYQGSLYRFCSKNCLDKFDADPDHYLNKEKGEAS